MRICSWNINGLRSLRQPLRTVLEELNCDIICFQETKVTRQALAEDYARIDGYHTFYSWSRLRQGYSGVAIFCKTALAPIRAEEGLAGKLNPSLDDGLGGDYPSMDEVDLQAIDREGRAIMTEHELEDGSSLVIINVYCPRVDRDKPERLTYKLNFFSAIEQRARSFVQRGCRVIIVGDFNVSHKTIDTCDPGEDLNYFHSSPSRLWFSNFVSNDQFIDTFRYVHPEQREAYTCWETLSSARVNNYGVRIDYIFCDGQRTKADLISCDHLVEMESSDHCPVVGEFRLTWKDRSREKPASICTKFWPEFKGTQMKMNLFLVKGKRTRKEEEEEVIVIDPPTPKEKPKETKPTSKKVKTDQSSLFQHFKRTSQPKLTPVAAPSPPSTSKEIEPIEKPKSTSTTSWSQIFRPPTPPPLCSGHQEHCVIRQVKDTSSANWGRYFFVCSRANGAADNPQARCDYFQWKETKKKTTASKK